jgi:predicted transporter
MTVRRYVLIQLLIHGPVTFVVWLVFFFLVVVASSFCDPVTPINGFLKSNLGSWFPGLLYVWAMIVVGCCMGWLAAEEAGLYDTEFPKGDQ